MKKLRHSHPTYSALAWRRAVITFRESRRRREMYCGHARLCVCVCASVCPRAACPHYCTDPNV